MSEKFTPMKKLNPAKWFRYFDSYNWTYFNEKDTAADNNMPDSSNSAGGNYR